MNYFKIIYRTGEEDWETSEVIIDESQYSKIQEQLSNGGDMIFIKDKATIKRSCITSIVSANDIVANYQRQGLKVDGLLEPANQPKLIGKTIPNKERVGEYLKRTEKSFKQKMGWK